MIGANGGIGGDSGERAETGPESDAHDAAPDVDEAQTERISREPDADDARTARLTRATESEPRADAVAPEPDADLERAADSKSTADEVVGSGTSTKLAADAEAARGTESVSDAEPVNEVATHAGPAADADPTTAAPSAGSDLDAPDDSVAPVETFTAPAVDPGEVKTEVMSVVRVEPPAAQSPEEPPTTVVAPPRSITPPSQSRPQQAQPQSQTPPPSEPRPLNADPVPADRAGGSGRSTGVKVAIGAAAALAVGILAYGVDYAMSSDQVPRGVSVAGVDVGGMNPADAEAMLRTELGPRVQQPVEVRAGDARAQVVPEQAGLGIDWSATLDRAGAQPLNPVTRLTSLFSHREIGVVSTSDEAALAAAVEGLRPQVDRAPVEGGIAFDGPTPTGVSPRAGQALDAEGAASALAEQWAAVGGVEVPVNVAPVAVTQDGVDRALRDIATPAAAADVTVTGKDGKSAVLRRNDIGAVLTFAPDGSGGLAPGYNVDAAAALLAPQLAPTEVKPKDATFSFAGGSPKVVPSVTGNVVEWHKTLGGLPDLLAAPGDRSVAAVYEAKEPELTTAAADKLGIREVVSEYTTGGFEYASGVNIRLAAAEINGALVKPGGTFSLNGHTGTRGAAEGYVESGIINNGRPDKAVGGGISQLATTLYNASYFAGMKDAGHTEHSYYISRYPAAREATVFDGAIDLQFTNTAPTGVVIEAVGTSSDVTVRFWGTKSVEVESIAGERYADTSPNTVNLPKGDGCVPSGGAKGFTTSDTRVISDHKTGEEISRHTRTVKYDPVPIVKCE
ncbi:VanW family protein [Rhodococcus tukisamuensis]|uniref:Vancomycin resistance protein YoaR, contains peptidoglycan-binding and VanW domains n=1 Tax=Rhodococcus tukisamuensis TaxID=168276 RepID=A0A1G6SQQ4_9NOCA|nr:VanW family protein [Rhodococcus tukisamuensis]SDD19014.1 Vancomycin resistance protein YoaR, contains peptidoglycan-binding and VanW domains [Rhodococcus tukisamuensis]